MPIKEISNDPVMASEDEPVNECAERMDRKDVGSLIVESSDTVAGVLTDRQIALAVAEHDGDLSSVTTGEIMTEGVVTLQEDDDSLSAARTMAEEGVRRIPVVDGSDSVVGIVSLDDVISLTGEQLEDAATVIEKQSPGYGP